jgi:hypothetical protein
MPNIQKALDAYYRYRKIHELGFAVLKACQETGVNYSELMKELQSHSAMRRKQ